MNGQQFVKIILIAYNTMEPTINHQKSVIDQLVKILLCKIFDI